MPNLTLSILPDRFAVCRLDPCADLPAWGLQGDFFAVTRTREELSIVCREAQVPGDIRRQSGWRALKVKGPLDFALTGILAGLANILAQANISLFAISTYDTDYLLVGEKDLPAVVRALQEAAYQVIE